MFKESWIPYQYFLWVIQNKWILMGKIWNIAWIYLVVVTIFFTILFFCLFGFLGIPILLFFNLSFIIANEKDINYLSMSRFNWLECGSASVLQMLHSSWIFHILPGVGLKTWSWKFKNAGKIWYKECNPDLVSGADSLLKINNNENNYNNNSRRMIKQQLKIGTIINKIKYNNNF